MKKTFLGLILQITLKFIGIFTGIFVSRWVVQNVSESSLSDYYIAGAYVLTIVSIIDLGISRLVQKFYTNPHKDSEVSKFWSSMQFFRILTFFLGVFIISLTYKISGISDLKLIYTIFIINFILVVDLSYRSIVDSKGIGWQYSLTDLISKIILVFLIFNASLFQVFNLDPLNYFLFVSIISYSIGLITDVIWQRKYTKLSKISINDLGKYTKKLLLLGFIIAIVALYTVTDKIFLKRFGFSDFEINSYGNAYKLYELLLVIPGLIVPVLASRAKFEIDNSFSVFLQNLQNYINLKTSLKLNRQKFSFIFYLLISTVISVLVSLFIFNISPFAIQIIDPALKYSLSIDILKILSISLPFASIAVFVSYFMIFIHLEKYDLIVAIITFIFTITCYYYGIKQFGAFGAAWSTVLLYLCDLSIKGLIFMFSKKIGNYFNP